MGEKKSTKFPPDEWFEVNNPASALIAIGRALRALEKGEAGLRMMTEPPSLICRINCGCETKGVNLRDLNGLIANGPRCRVKRDPADLGDDTWAK